MSDGCQNHDRGQLGPRKPKGEPPVRPSEIVRLKVKPDPDFDCWWSINHPFDWWAKQRDGEPLPTSDRLRVWEICHAAWDAARKV